MDRRVRWLKDLLWAFVLLGFLSAFFRLWFGLGTTTNLSDNFPWGLWKILNMVGGVALSTSGFTVGFLVFVLGIRKFRHLVKPAVLIAFLGYGSSCLALLFDIGLPQRFWHPIFFWNEHSFLFEVFWCVLLYFTVTAIEISPTVLQKWGWTRLVNFLEKAAFGLVILGITLSCLHHSSLGSLFLVTPLRLHPLWYTPFLPVHFFSSAVGAGLMMVVLVKVLFDWFNQRGAFERKPEDLAACMKTQDQQKTGSYPQLSDIVGIATIVLTVHFLIKVVDLIVRGNWNYLYAWNLESALFFFEMLLLFFIPFTLLFMRRIRHRPFRLVIASGSAVLGLILNRLNVGIFGYFQDAGQVYFPSLIEWMLSLGTISGAILVFLFCAEHLSVFSGTSRETTSHRIKPVGSLRGTFQVPKFVLGKGLYRQSLIAVFIIPLGWLLLYPPYWDSSGDKVITPSQGVDPLRRVLMIDGNRSQLRTFFPHFDHQERLGGIDSCGSCHHLSMPGDNSTPCSRCHEYMEPGALIFDHARHTILVAVKENLTGLYPQNHSCTICHLPGHTKTKTTAKSCLDCHELDMKPRLDTISHTKFSFAPGFREVMHKTCLDCHKKEANDPAKARLSQCWTCHDSLTPFQIRKDERFFALETESPLVQSSKTSLRMY